MTDTLQIYCEMSIGDQLGHLEYVITDENLALFRESVEFPEAAFPSIAVKEYLAVLAKKFGEIPFISAKHTERYFSPPKLGRSIQVSGWIRDKYERRGRNWLVVETLAVDEIGTEILRSEHTILIGAITRSDSVS